MVHEQPVASGRYNASNIEQYNGTTFYAGHPQSPSFCKIKDGQLFINQDTGIKLTRIAATEEYSLGYSLIKAALQLGPETLDRQIDLYGIMPEKGLCLVLAINPEDPITKRIGAGIVTPPILEIRQHSL